MSLHDRILKLLQDSNSISHAPILSNINLDDCREIDALAEMDEFIRSKRAAILNRLSYTFLDSFDKQKNIFNDYIEIQAYRDLKEDVPVERFPESDSKTPDFKISYSDKDYYIEVKSLSFNRGNINYRSSMDSALKANIDNARQLDEGKNIAISTFEIQPYYTGKKNYDPFSCKIVIDTIIEKIEQNLKADQFSKGDTVLLVDTKQLIIHGFYKQCACPVYVRETKNCFVSGQLWNVAFSRPGFPVLRSIEFEGTSNIEDYMDKEGILVRYPFVKALCFRLYEDQRKCKVVGFVRSQFDEISGFLHEFCDFQNDEGNFNGFEIFNE